MCWLQGSSDLSTPTSPAECDETLTQDPFPRISESSGLRGAVESAFLHSCQLMLVLLVLVALWKPLC